MKIGLETHVTLDTKTKLFCSCPTSKAQPNGNTCPTCLGLPGAKPTVNKKAIEQAVKAAVALNFSIRKESRFARKTYYYPDLSKNFQITQYDEPIAEKGFLEINSKKIMLTRLHLEEDPAQILYPYGNISSSSYVWLDYNRSGMPLIEIVTDPCIESPAEAKEYLEELFRLLSYLGIIDASAERVMKTDANISIENGERVEIKNITSFAAVEKALQAEYFRQRKLLQEGKKVELQTRQYSEETDTTILMRSKEEEEDYGYIVEPDLPPLKLADGFISETKNSMRELPKNAIERIAREVPAKYAHVLVYHGLADYYVKCRTSDRAYLARWLCEDFMKCLNYCGKKPEDIEPRIIDELVSSIKAGKITERAAKEYIKEIVAEGKTLGEVLKEKENKAEPFEPEELAEKIIRENAKAVEDFKEKKEEALEFLVGEYLKKDETLHPNEVRKMLKSKTCKKN
ncbi:Asp-tRNA(Asn)/Glu-tRNA(Gln) amidotransferase subunit GatB [Candidatus Micrarchaeota archaeon]|nr:Asp-tRNA(Asn)/Glu-tRNA(Gln) amidotransferase subunit GatB [Candidatus Micrarchaeota archaeon]